MIPSSYIPPWSATKKGPSGALAPQPRTLEQGAAATGPGGGVGGDGYHEAGCQVDRGAWLNLRCFIRLNCWLQGLITGVPSGWAMWNLIELAMFWDILNQTKSNISSNMLTWNGLKHRPNYNPDRKKTLLAAKGCLKYSIRSPLG